MCVSRNSGPEGKVCSRGDVLAAGRKLSISTDRA
jgi:hypothetical protein